MFLFNREELLKSRISMGVFSFLAEDIIARDFLQIDIRSKKMFAQSAREVSEAIFYIALLGYQNSLDVYYHKLSLKSEPEESTSMSSSSLDHAKKALRNAMAAAERRTAGEEDKANELALYALSELNER
jgi:hypothetical protein